MTAGPLLLVVAGHDPSGAGLDADREATKDLEIEFEGIATAHTDQDDAGVRSIGARAPREWLREAFGCVLRDLGAVKFGLLPGADHVSAARDLVQALRERHGDRFPVVVDPVISASSGARFLDAEGCAALRRELLPARVILTPNLAELAELARADVKALERALEPRLAAARELLSLGAEAVLVKGGHGREDPVRDLVARSDGRFQWLLHERVPGGKLRGSGCRFASRLAALLSLGASLETAATEAAAHVTAGIRAARRP